jgi:hypothetical protein
MTSGVKNEMPVQQAPQPAPNPFGQTPIPVVVQNQKEEVEPHIIDDTDQKELAKSMTKFFDTLVEEARGDDKEAK